MRLGRFESSPVHENAAGSVKRPVSAGEGEYLRGGQCTGCGGQRLQAADGYTWCVGDVSEPPTQAVCNAASRWHAVCVLSESSQADGNAECKRGKAGVMCVCVNVCFFCNKP